MIITRGLGADNLLITRGFGKTLYVIIPTETEVIKTGGGLIGWEDPPYIYEPYKDFDRSIIRTKHIKVPFFKEPIFVDCILISKETKLEQISIIAKSLGYKNIKIINSVDVELIE